MNDADVLVIGAGSAGIAAACAAARNGARTLLVDAGPMAGGELVSGIPLLGCLTMRGEWVVGGVVRELLALCGEMDGHIGPVSDFRSLNTIAYDPEVMKLAVIRLLAERGVRVLLYSFAEAVERAGPQVTGVWLRNKAGRTLVTARAVIDCSGDADIALQAGAAVESGDPASGAFQALTLMFRLSGVETMPLLHHLAANPDSYAVRDNALLGLTQAECIAGLLAQAQPKLAVHATGPLLGDAVRSGEMYPVSVVAVAPVSTPRQEVSVNATRIADVDATDPAALSATLPELVAQMRQCIAFLRRRVPGFEHAQFAGVAPRIGIRETRRIQGEYLLSGEDVLAGRRFPDAIGRGAHEIDVHGAGTEHRRQVIPGGGSYDVPFRSLIPRGLGNLLVAGRCFSSTREGQSSARVMGTCMAMGQAAGTAAALAARANAPVEFRATPLPALQQALREQGAVL